MLINIACPAGAACLPLKARLWKSCRRNFPIGKWWTAIIKKTFLFPDFKSALDFVNRVGAVAEAEGHHPDLCISWGRVDAITYTHKIKGLTESDFVLAAKIDRIFFEK